MARATFASVQLINHRASAIERSRYGSKITKQLVRDALEDEIIFNSGHDIMSDTFYDKFFDVSHLVKHSSQISLTTRVRSL